jgi:ComF family protein
MTPLFSTASFLFQQFYNLVYPISCIKCSQIILEETLLCKPCEAKHIPLVSKTLNINKRYELKVFALSDYQKPLNQVVLAKFTQDLSKYKFATSLINEKIIKPSITFSQMDNRIFIPVPSHWKRKLKRGFNQTEILAEYLSKETSIPTHNILERIKPTQFQQQLDSQARTQNLKQAFQINPAFQSTTPPGSNFIIIDDLCTTGTTLLECAKSLTKLNPASISAIVVCRTT